MILRDRFLGCILGGAAGDALGGAVEFLPRDDIISKFGAEGIKDFDEIYGVVGAITDDTQMTLFTAEGLLCSWALGNLVDQRSLLDQLHLAYLRWLLTQDCSYMIADSDQGGWLTSVHGLWSRRAPGMTCLSALQGAAPQFHGATNDSKGCGGVMRVAPIGLVGAGKWEPQVIFGIGSRAAASTHGHPVGQTAAGALAVIVASLCKGENLSNALRAAEDCLKKDGREIEVYHALRRARRLATAGEKSADCIAELGEGWVAEEALAIAVYCALVAQSLEEGIVLAVNHSGDSDSTGSIAGNILGAALGIDQVPRRWLDQLELCEVIKDLTLDLYEAWQGNLPDHELEVIRARYRVT